MNIRILRNQCCGSGECAEIAPSAFRLDSKSKCTVMDAEAAPLETLIEAAEACPCGAIEVEDDSGEWVAG
jgi:ferredoxin